MRYGGDGTMHAWAVTGAGHGFGREIALSLSTMGCTVFACDGPSETARQELGTVVAAAVSLAGSIEVEVVDFTDEAEVRGVTDHRSQISTFWSSMPAACLGTATIRLNRSTWPAGMPYFL